MTNGFIAFRNTVGDTIEHQLKLLDEAHARKKNEVNLTECRISGIKDQIKELEALLRSEQELYHSLQQEVSSLANDIEKVVRIQQSFADMVS